MNVNTVQITCCAAGCGVPWWVEEGFSIQLHKDHRTFHCPNGHPQSFRGVSDEVKLAHAEMRLAVSRVAASRLQRELDKTPCPHCQKRYADIDRHIKKQHTAKWKIARK